ncbi:hypothetical protein QBC34DRAFT_332627 [Podospora aff. communis PSN243]|uniref:Fungal STAND N-terminal Goodbye domain-containing protein n=1 Tax=Podospora aff. communis PSN243 TaxID=3040156 RepID=A0AAV9GCJ6_9PEZI|nr:hypothetical protein QBC34DRAFT_332627 [Podospora aff. communis PSN243]
MTGQSVTTTPVERKAPGLTTMEELWADAAKKFEEICGQSLQKGDVKGFDDVQKRIESAGMAATKPEDEKAKKWEKAKSVGLVSLRLLKMLVGAASQASSVIPIPGSVATVTSTALCFVFDIPEAIKGYEDAIDQVFSEVSSSLTQFQIYTSMEQVQQVHPSLIRQIHLVMISFVKVCAHVVKYRQGRRRDRLLQRVKSIFEDDSGLSDEMTEFKRVLQQQRDVEGTVTLGVVVEARRDIALILEQFIVFGKTTEETNQLVSETQKGVQALRAESDRINTLVKIRNALDVSNTVRLDTTTTQTCDNLYSKCLEGTGLWLWDQEEYGKWTAPLTKDKERDPNSHILILSGPASSGKTSASAMVTKRLEEQKGRTFVAHYFWPTNTKRSDDAEHSVQSVLKYMAFQIARVDGTVLRALGKACDAGSSVFRRAGQDGLETLWDELKIGGSSSGATYYLVFDGIENLRDKQAEMLLKFAFGSKLADTGGRVRVLLGGTDEKFEAFQGIIDSRPAFRIGVQAHNAADMRLVIEDALAKRGMLQNVKPGSSQWRARTEILEKLPKNVGGSYSRLQFGLDDVVRLLSTRTAFHDLDRILDQSTSSHETAIKTLQRSLTAEEVGELNELLKWVLFSRQPMDLDTLEEAMFLSSGTESLVSLQYIIENKYSAVLKIEDGFAYGQDGVEQYLRSNEKGRAHRGSDSEGNGGRPTISMTITISNVDQEVCGHFLWDLAHKAIRDKFRFEFDTASNSALHQGGSQAIISVDEFEAHRTIVNRTFKYLLGMPPVHRTKKIADYMVCWLPYHLERLRQLEFDEEEVKSLTPSEQSEIGQNLYKLFTDTSVLSRFHSSFEKTYWTVYEMDTIQDWLMDSSVAKRLDRKWRTKVQKAVSPTRGVLLDFVKVVVQGFLRERSWSVSGAFRWVGEFMEIEHKKFKQPSKIAAGDNDGETGDDASSTSSVSRAGTNWDEVSTWCRNVLGLSEAQLDSLWFERLAEACFDNDSSATATTLSLWQQAIAKPNPSWRCHQGMAIAYASEGKYQEAVAAATLASEEAGKEDASPKPSAEEIVDLQLLLGEYYYQLKDFDKTAEFFLAASKSEDPVLAMKGHFGYLQARLFQPGAASVRDHLRSTLSERPDGGEILMVGLLKTIAQHADHDRLMARIFTVSYPNQPLLGGIVRAMEVASEKPTPSKQVAEGADSDTEGAPPPVDIYAEETTRGILLFDRGVAAYRYKVAPDGQESVSEALRLWNECLEILSRVGGQNAFNARKGAISGLTSHYYQSMVDGNHSDHIAALTKLADIDASTFYGDAAGYLGAIHALRGDRAKAQAALKARTERALQVLSDDSPDNDMFGWGVLHPTLEHYRDMRNASVALSMLGQPDLVTEALSAPVPEIEGVSHEKLVTTYNELKKQAIETAISKVPDSSEQLERIAAAKSYVESLQSAMDEQRAGDKPNGIQPQEAHIKDAKVATSALDMVTSRLNILSEEHTPSLNHVDTTWFCDGCTSDGTACANKPGFDHPFYHCLTCFNIDFCPDCFKKLRGESDPEGVDIMVCSRKHKWLRVPPLGGPMFVGLRADRARAAKEVRPLDDDENVLEIIWDDEVVDISAFKETLAKEWGLSIEQMRRNSSNDGTSDSSDSE